MQIGNIWGLLVVWKSETRPIRGAGSLDSLTRAALQENWRDRAVEILYGNWCLQNGGQMAGKMKDEILHDHNHDGIDRRGFLKCMGWAGTGVLCVMCVGVMKW